MRRGIKDTPQLFGPSNCENSHHVFNKKESGLEQVWEGKFEFMHITF